MCSMSTRWNSFSVKPKCADDFRAGYDKNAIHDLLQRSDKARSLPYAFYKMAASRRRRCPKMGSMIAIGHRRDAEPQLPSMILIRQTDRPAMPLGIPTAARHS